MWDSFIEAVTKVNDWVNGVVWGLPMIIMILGTGILLTVRTRVLQVRKFGESMSSTIVPAVKDMKKSKKGRDKKPFRSSRRSRLPFRAPSVRVIS